MLGYVFVRFIRFSFSALRFDACIAAPCACMGRLKCVSLLLLVLLNFQVLTMPLEPSATVTLRRTNKSSEENERPTKRKNMKLKLIMLIALRRSAYHFSALLSSPWLLRSDLDAIKVLGRFLLVQTILWSVKFSDQKKNQNCFHFHTLKFNFISLCP